MPNFKFIKNRKKISNEELSQQANFDELMKQYNASAAGAGTGTGSAISGAKLIAGLAVVAAFTAIAYLTGIIGSKEHSKTTHELAIKPPFDGLDIEKVDFTITMDRDTTLIYKTGSAIHIPANAFEHLDGSTVKGKVTLKYREFHSVLDILISGIPMDYDTTANGKWVLETGGMLECRAYEGEKELKLKKDKAIDIAMISNTADEDFNLYNFNDTTGAWTYAGRSSKEEDNLVPLFNDEVVRSYEEEIYRNVEPVMPNKANSSNDRIKLDFLINEFPELSAFKNMEFELAKEDSTFETWFTSKTWENISMKRTISKNTYALILESGDQKKRIKVKPVLNTDNIEEELAMYHKRFEEYKTKLNSRLKDENYRNSILSKQYAKAKHAADWDDVNDVIEERINNGGLITYQKLFIGLDTISESKEIAVRAIRMREMGIANCDRPQYTVVYSKKLERALGDQNLTASRKVSFKDAKGNNAQLDKLYAIPKKAMSVVSFNPVNGEVKDFRCTKDGVKAVFGVTKKGYPAKLSEAELNKIQNSEGDISVHLEVGTKKFDTKEELEAFLNMKFTKY